MTPDAQEMFNILQNLENAQSIGATTAKTAGNHSTQAGDPPSHLKPEVQEMHNILSKLHNVQDATDTVATEMVTESVETIPQTKQNSVGVDRFNIVLEKSDVAGFSKTYYTVAENGVPVHTELALFESAMAIIKNKLFKDDTAKTKAIVESDSHYASALVEAAQLKRKLKTLTEGVDYDVTAARHNMATDRMKKAKASIKKLL